MSPPLLTKEAARYTRAGGKEHCSLCRHFSPRRGGRCARVLGEISPMGWCKLFSREMRALIADASSFNGGGGGPSLSLDFMSPGTLDPRLTFTRASSGTYFDSAGILRSAATNAPRWDHDPATLALRGLLLEEARTNSIVNSSVFTDASWAKTEVTATGSAGAAPDGTNTMQRVAETAANALHYIWQLSAVPASATLTQSVFIKMAQVRYVQMFLDNGGSVGGFATFDLQAGTISGPLTAMSGATIGTASIVPVGNGIYRCALTTTIGASTSARFGLILTQAPNGPFASGSYLGNTANGMLFWGAQLEAGAFATSYIPTTSAAVTRAQDLATILPADMAPWFKPTGSWFAEFILANPAPSGDRIVAAATAVDGGIGPLMAATAPYQLGMWDGASFFATANNITPNTVQRGANTTSGAASLGKMCLNGGSVASAVITNGLAALATSGVRFLNVRAGASDDNGNGHLRRVAYYGRVLTDAEMQQITAGDPPSLDLNFMVPGALDSRIAFSRASTATYTDSLGTIQTAVVNQPRWDHDPATRALRGLLLEEARTNLILNSQFAANWAGGDAFVTPNFAQSPDGGTTAARVSEGGTAATVHYITQAVAKAASPVTYAISVFLKPGSGNRNLQFQIDDGGSNGIQFGINPATGAIVAALMAFGTGWSATAHTYTPVNNGWGRVSFNVTAGAQTGIRTVLMLMNGASVTYNGDNASNVLMYGYQMEAGAFATSYIPTAGSAQTRAADNATMPTAGGWFNASAGSLSVEFSISQAASPGTQGGVARLDDATDNNAVSMFVTAGSGVLYFYAAVGGVAQLNNTHSVAVNGTPQKAAVSYGAGPWRYAENGVVGSGAGSATPMPATRLLIGNASATLSAWKPNGYLRTVRYWPRALADHELIAATYNPGATLLPAPEPPDRLNNELPEAPAPRGRRNGR